MKSNFKLSDYFSEELYGNIVKITKALAEAGGHPYLVGGCVRDLLIGIKPKDADIEVFNLPQQELENILNLVGNKKIELIGKSFGVYKIGELDISLPRTERATGSGHKDFKITVLPGISLKEAARRRDITINALNFDLLNNKIEDPFNGLEDLKNKTIKHIDEQTFTEDPLRVYRAVQFAARFEFKIAPETIILCKKIDISQLPKERIFEEFSKLLLRANKPSIGFNYAKEIGILKYFPELQNLIHCEQEPEWHPEGDVWNHTLLSMDAASLLREYARFPMVFMLSVLCHDLGKPETTKVEDGRIKTHGHEEAGESYTREFLSKITHDKDLTEKVVVLVKKHLMPHHFYVDKNNIRDSAFKRLAVALSKAGLTLEDLELVARADSYGRKGYEKKFTEGDWFLERAKQIGVKDSSPEPILMGRHLIQEFNLTPSPVFGKILSAVYEMQLEGKVNNLKEALELAKDKIDK